MAVGERTSGGGSGIRTLEGLSPLLVFKTSAFDHSANPPVFLVHLLALILSQAQQYLKWYSEDKAEGIGFIIRFVSQGGG